MKINNGLVIKNYDEYRSINENMSSNKTLEYINLNDIGNPITPELNALYHEQDVKLQDIRHEYDALMQELYKKHNKKRDEILEKFKTLKEKIIEKNKDNLTEWIKKKLMGKLLLLEVYSNDGYNFNFNISRVIKVDFKIIPATSNLRYSYYEFVATCENGEKIKGTHQGFLHTTPRIIDNFLKHLKRNIGKEFRFTGTKLSKVQKYLKDKPRSKSIDKIYFDQSKNYSIKLETIGITNVPKIGDFIIINNEYLFDPNMSYEIISRRIDSVDPYGEENWGDEMDWEKIDQD